MRIEELIKELKIFQSEMPSSDVIFRFDNFDTMNYELIIENGLIVVDLDYLNTIEEDEWI